MGTEKIPFLDLVTPHVELEEELISIFREAIRSGRFIGGPAVDDFEKSFARFCGSRYAIGVGSGTDAVRFALIAAGIGPGDTVVTVPNTFIATTEAISQAGAITEFVDVNEKTHTMSAPSLRLFLENQCSYDAATRLMICRKTGSPIRAIVPVHLYGQVTDMDPLMEIAEKYGMIIIEDACQAHGAGYYSSRTGAWLNAGAIGNAGAFSFYPGKNLGAFGEGGAVTTDSDEMAKIIRMLRDHGQTTKYYHEIEGYNGRLDSIQAGLLGVKLRFLDTWNQQRRECAERYDRLLSGIPGIEVPHVPEWSKPVYHLYVVKARNRDALQQHLANEGIGTGLHYPVPLHLQNVYSSLGYGKGSFPVSERLSEDILSLPMFPNLSAGQQEKVCNAISAFSTRKDF